MKPSAGVHVRPELALANKVAYTSTCAWIKGLTNKAVGERGLVHVRAAVRVENAQQGQRDRVWRVGAVAAQVGAYGHRPADDQAAHLGRLPGQVAGAVAAHVHRSPAPARAD